MVPRPNDVIVHSETGLLSTSRGVSVSDRPDGLARFGGTYLVGDLPDSLEFRQVGRNPHHFEIVPGYPMALAEYEEELSKIVLTPV